MEKREIWKDVKGYEGIYQISNLGRVKSLKFKKERVLKNVILNNGYCAVSLCKNNTVKVLYIHRLVAETFISNPSNLKEINHKDEVKTNNTLSNLEWCTRKYNCNYGTSSFKKSLSLSQAVCQFDINGNFISEYSSLKEAAKAVNVTPPNISKACNGVSKTCLGFIWKKASSLS